MARWLVIVFLVLAAVFPFYYMLVLSFVQIEELQRNPLRIFPDLAQLTTETYQQVLAPESDRKSVV